MSHWNLLGKFAIASKDAHGKTLRQSANLQWLQSGEQHYSIHLSGPLGQGSTLIKGDPQQVSLQMAGANTLTAPNADELLQKTLGYSLPIDALYYWLRGLPKPTDAIQNAVRNDQGSLLQLSQLGWQLNYSRYSIHKSLILPGKIVATKGPSKLTLIIKDWQLP